ncbi:serine/threonine protein kinase [Sorangium sp. So ce204]|uniref:serine/threonine protein kinase n=1 Tax=Sorangium sp. So ce204 TaxID=3133288 RepID=UPI003F5DFA2D
MSLNFNEGMLFAGRYRVVRSIATGAMGAVYEVVHVETDRRRALKVMHPHLAENPEFHARFKLEARIAARIATEHIVEVFDAGIDLDTGMPFLVMELLRGEELSKRIRRGGRLPPENAIAYLRQTAHALDKTHAAGVVHRDLKPANLFLAASDDDDEIRIKVLDFGIAKLVAETAVEGANTAALGTPLYMAPEQFSGETITRAVDLFALGMIAYTTLVGKAYWLNDMREYSNSLAFAVIAMHGPQEPPSVRAEKEGVKLPPGFDAWFAKATARDPGTRFPTASSTVEALAEVFDIAPMTVRSSRLAVLETPFPRMSPASQGPASSMPVAAQSSSTGVETRVGTGTGAGTTAGPRSRSALAVAAIALVGGSAIALAAFSRGGSPAPGPAEHAQAAQAAAVAPPSTPPDAAPGAARPEAAGTPSSTDLAAPASSASAPPASSASAPPASSASAPPADGGLAIDPEVLANAKASPAPRAPAPPRTPAPPPGAWRKIAPAASSPAAPTAKPRESLYGAD